MTREKASAVIDDYKKVYMKLREISIDSGSDSLEFTARECLELLRRLQFEIVDQM